MQEVSTFTLPYVSSIEFISPANHFGSLPREDGLDRCTKIWLGCDDDCMEVAHERHDFKAPPS